MKTNLKSAKCFLFGLALGVSAFLLVDYIDFLVSGKKNKQDDSSETGIGGYWSSVGNYLSRAINNHEEEQKKKNVC